MVRLYHVSEEPGIVRFEPRPPPTPDSGVAEPVVWAIEEATLHTYLLPRDCPRVTFYATAKSSAADIVRLLDGDVTRRVVAVESAWLQRIRCCHLWLYEFSSETFERIDAGAGYWISRRAEVPLSVAPVPDSLAALAARGVEVRLLPSLWGLRDAVVASSLHFSLIRMRHAAPRT